ncbi:Ribosomal protein S18 acetylase RimI [Desulfacinum infernum DSM 9756]|uniref:Ribosomal protein S18 acetylase RimI n=1 Tax=Desulfacinum infernum DSM 9756 TaxID=1121391 RepID=A0A1M4XMF4_9BACT|nr:GNAT family N-acetyltransferase [Desulfacinum infernum]SHE94665.1 Ribosomal protein S18 acetylase RimI [Desulfacinum infernum DSM 9756]
MSEPVYEMKFAFRDARPGDLMTVLALLLHLGYPRPSNELEPIYRTLIEDAQYRCILALAPPDDAVAGMVTFRTQPVLRLAGIQTTIEELVVLPEWRGFGLGRALVNLAVEVSRHKRAARLEVVTSEERESTRRLFYEKAGLQRAWSRIYRLDFPHMTRHSQPGVRTEESQALPEEQA